MPSSIHHLPSSLLLFAACVLLSGAGCGSPLVEPGRGASPGGIVGPQAISVQPAEAAATPPLALPPGATGNLPHVPASQLLNRRDPDQNALYHEVRSGETLSEIAAQYKVPVQRLVKANGLDAGSSLKAGQLIYIARGQE